MTERVYAELSDGRNGWYVVTEEHPDGSFVITPDGPTETGQGDDGDKDAQPSPGNRPPNSDSPAT